MQETGSIAGAPGTQPLSNAELLELECDVLILAALEGQVTAENAGRINARVLAEGANGPTMPEADPILRERGVTVIPDILCNAGGVVVSYFEWVQNLQSLSWEAEEVNERLRKVLLAAYDEVDAMQREQEIDARLAAHAIAVPRVAQALRIRGQYP
jgi:glutamate dehydrogenase (NAD(P)+)